MAFDLRRLKDAFAPGALPGLRRTRIATRAAMVAERLWPLLLPILTVASLFVSLSWLGVFHALPDPARLGLAVLFALAALASLWPLRAYAPPSPDEVDRRIETANGLRHAPLRTTSDRLSGAPDPFAAALWNAHRSRLASGVERLSPDAPRPGIPARDPYALRALTPLLLAVAFAVSLGPQGGSLADAFRLPQGAPSVPPRIDAWVTPPSYTGQAPIYLTSDTQADQGGLHRVPEGSAFVVRVMGGAGTEALGFLDAHTAQETRFDAASTGGDGARQFAGTLDADGLLSLVADDGADQVASWSFTVTPDVPPVIAFEAEPDRAANGGLQLVYRIEDDYGAARAEARIAPADPAPDARPLYEPPQMRLSLPRPRAETPVARTARDLTDHPFAGTQVDVVLEAEDGAGQVGRSEPRRIVLPERTFSHPLALALVEQRQLLARDANARRRVLALMDAITSRPEDTIDNLSHYLGIMAARSRLASAADDDALRGVADYLWEIALAIEDGTLTDAERRLRMAQEALQDALENGASDEEIAQLMAELREAMQEFLREYAERAMQNPQSAMPLPENAIEMTPDELDRMMDRIEELARSGAREDAQELLAQLQEMMNGLQAGNQPQPQQDGAQDEMRRQMDELGRIMRQQQELMNETFRMQQEQQQAETERGEGAMSREEFAEAMRDLQQGQEALREELDAMAQALEGMGMQPGEGFGQSGEAMGRAGQALGGSEGERAVAEQGQALEALRRGAQDMMQQMQQAMEGTGQQPGGQSRQGAGRDPLGRPQATGGPDFGDSVRVPDEIDAQRARRILEAIRERLGNALSPAIERDYLDRLLEMR